jgi:hypothetical protein
VAPLPAKWLTVAADFRRPRSERTGREQREPKKTPVAQFLVRQPDVRTDRRLGKAAARGDRGKRLRRGSNTVLADRAVADPV